MISNTKATEGVGTGTIKKRIHAGSESIMFSVLQETQYMYPYKSAVREIVSNCIDSISEKNNSLKILSGELKVSDLYIEKEGAEFKESGFDQAYYDPKWLNEKDDIIIEYIEQDTETRDRIRFIDNGVGLGRQRLIAYFSLGFSSKRLSKSQLGNFGLGAKSLLATGVDFYTVTSRYNGRVYSFNIYKDHVTPAIDKFNEDGTKNEVEIFKDADDSDILVYYRNTKKKNRVIVEAEVKRHRKQDYVGGIKSQLGFIKNIEFRTKYGREDSHPTVSNIKNKVVYSSDSLIVGESDYYAVPQIILKPGEDSEVLLNYGPVNFPELEMKKYAGNVCFIMNINDVDVTPSRENVIWNSRTRDAIKNVIIKAQDTVADMIQKKIKGAKNLPEHMALFEGLKTSTNSVPGLSELYKIVDISSVSTKYKNFRLSSAMLNLEERELEKDIIFTKTEKPGNYGYSNRKTGDTNFNSSVSGSYLANMSPSMATNIVLYVGKTKYKHLARYVNHVYDLDNDDSIYIIYMKDDVYEFYMNKVKETGLETMLTAAYKSTSTDPKIGDVLIYEALRIGIEDPKKLLLDADIDKTKMSTLEKVEEEKEDNQYLTWQEKAKLDGKVIGNKHYSATSTNREYYNEASLNGMSGAVYIYNMGNPFVDRMMKKCARYTSLSDYNIIGFADENFKRFYKQEGIKLLVDNLFSIQFGTLKFTFLGRLLLDDKTKRIVRTNYTNRESGDDLEYTAYSFLDGHFRDTDIEASDYGEFVDSKVAKIQNKIKEEYLTIND